MKEVTKNVTITKYIADDGTEFDNKYECENYDDEILASKVESIPHEMRDGEWLFDGSCFNLLSFFKIETEEHANYLEKWVRRIGIDELKDFDGSKLVGKYVVVDGNTEGDERIRGIYQIYDALPIEEYIAKYTKRILGCLPK